jgi:opacity protein-like surface antigen
MNRTILAVALMSVIGATVTSASAGTPGYYVTGEGGVSLLPDLDLRGPSTGAENDSFSSGYAYGGALGYDTGDGTRIELSSLYQDSSLTKLGATNATGHLSSTSLMANATYDLANDWLVTPYLGAGLGVQNVGGWSNNLHGRDWEPAYQVEAGLRHELGEDVSVFSEFRFSQSESVALSSGSDIAHQHFADHLLLVGLSYHVN